MADKYVPIFYDWIEATQELNDQEKGRLIDAVVLYARGGDWQDRIKGNERYAFPVFRLQVDRARSLSIVRSDARKTKTEQTTTKQTKANKSTNNNNNKNNNKNNNNHDDDDDARAGADPLIMYAVNNLQHMSPGNLEELAGFAESLTADVIMFAVDEANANGAPRWAYVAAILRGYLRDGIKTVGDARAAKVRREAGQAKGGRKPPDNPALNYDQREYKGEDFGDNFFLDVVAEYGDKGGKNDA